MLKALKELNGHTTEEMSALIGSILDKGLRGQILEELEIERRPLSPSFINAMESEIAYGLGDNDEEPPRPSKKKTPVTEEMLEHDLDIDDPVHEAKAEAADTDAFLFGGDYEDPRITKRKKILKTKAKVSEHRGEEREESMY
jgi:hypothetical protein